MQESMSKLDELIEAAREEYCRWWYAYEVAIRGGANDEDTQWAMLNMYAADTKYNRLQNIKHPNPTSPEPTPPNGRRTPKKVL